MFPAGSVATPPRRSPDAGVLKYANVAGHPSPRVSVAVSELPAPHEAPTVKAAVAPPPTVKTVFGRAKGACCASAVSRNRTQDRERIAVARQNLRSMTCLRGNGGE